MIGSLRGTLLLRDDNELVVEVSNIGYRVRVAPNTSVSVGDEGQQVLIHTCHHIREDGQTLFGFCTPQERRLFEALIATHNVGPALGLSILSVHSPTELAAILAADDIDALCLVPGVGKKTAARLLVELKSRLDIGDVTSAISSADAASNPQADARSEVRQALAELGYGPDEVKEAIAALPESDDISALLRSALQHLAVH
ncbi:MAG: Holliday junction branch migration protein RuvA [bacterium]|nr:Holliday junction branch migration protein RuvA [bacterium]